MGARPPYPLTFKGNRGAVLARRFFLCAKGLRTEGRRSRTILNHGGQAPIPPLLNNRIVREESMCEEQRLCEHVFSGKMTTNIACGVDRLHCPCNRMRPPQERVQGYQISSPHHSGAAARVGLTGPAVPSFGCGMPRTGAASTEYASMCSLTK